MIVLKRIYEEYSPEDGFRILVDRPWPRGISKEKAHLDLWLKDIAPSTELRKWFSHDPAKWEEFVQKYQDELATNPNLKTLQDIVQGKDKVTLLYGAKDTEHNEAKVIAEYLK